MKARWLLYILPVWLVIGWSCSSQNFPMTQEFKDNNRSDRFNNMDGPTIHFLDYRIANYDYSAGERIDSVIREGIILAGRSIRTGITDIKFNLSSPADTCRVKCQYIRKYEYYGRSAAVSILNLFSKNKQPQETFEIILEDQASGTISLPGNNPARFSFNDITKENKVKGWLLIDADSFRLAPAFRIRKNYDNDSAFAGFHLLKGDIIYGAMGAPGGVVGKIYIYTKATAKQQMLIAAFLANIQKL